MELNIREGGALSARENPPGRRRIRHEAGVKFGP
jgi:hypothetical protein